MLETLEDTRAMIDDLDSGQLVELVDGTLFACVFDQGFDGELQIGGQRSAIRILNSDADRFAVDATLTIISGDQNNPDSTVDYIAREKQRGQRTTLVLLEATA